MRYRCNTIARLRATALDAGFRGAEFRVLEQAGMFETYFPTWFRWAPRAYSRLHQRVGPAGAVRHAALPTGDLKVDARGPGEGDSLRC